MKKNIIHDIRDIAIIALVAILTAVLLITDLVLQWKTGHETQLIKIELDELLNQYDIYD